MEFPKAIMRASELVQMGFPPQLLRRAYGARGQRFAVKINPEKRNSPIVFYTPGLADWIEKDIAAQDKSLRRG